MQDLSKKIKLLKFRKKIWKSLPYKIYINFYKTIIFFFISNTIDKKIIYINGMRRSGNHYLMKTLMDSTDHTVFFFNNQNPDKDLSIISGFQLKLKSYKKLLIIIGYEDLFIEDYLSKIDSINKNHDFYNHHYLTLLVKRDVKNLMASRLNHPHMGPYLIKHKRIREETKKLWLDHHDNNNLDKLINIRFNHMLDDLKSNNLYKFGIKDVKINGKIMNRYGGGSSFDDFGFNKRYKDFENNKYFNYLISDLSELSLKVYFD